MWLWITLAIGAALLALGRMLRRRPKLSRGIFALLAVYLLAILSVTAVCWTQPDDPTGEADYALLLGCALVNGEATPELERRLQLALDWLEETENLPLVISGGDPGGQGVTEAQVMARWLEDHGADMARVWLDPEARDTRQNISNAALLVKSMEREFDTVLLLTSDYHQTRARFLARQNGQMPLSRSCATPFPRHLPAAVREVYSFANELLEILVR